MSLDEQIRVVTDRVLTDLRGQLESHLLGHAADVSRLAAEHARASDEAAPANLAGQTLRLEEFVQTIRELDGARTLADVLNHLVQFAATEADRAAVLMLAGDALREWRSVGFGTSAASGPLPLDAAGLAGAVARSGVPARRPAGPASENRHPTWPPPTVAGESRHAIAVPITVSGQVVGVLYADARGSGSGQDSASWPAILEVTARHASRVLEVITLRHAVGLHAPTAVAQPSQNPGPAESSARSLQ